LTSYLLDAWHESSLYTERERAALAWTEALTRIAETRAPDATYDEVRRHFEDKELVDLTTLHSCKMISRSAMASPRAGPNTCLMLPMRI
jgi:alkylhydroperoxidase family enzyme